MTVIELLQTTAHYGLHLLFPGWIAWKFYGEKWKKVYLIMLATMLVDLDHLIATPIFDPDRCGIGFHPLHSYYAIAVYCIMLFFPKTRIVAIGLVLHMFTDFLDCLWMWFIKNWQLMRLFLSNKLDFKYCYFCKNAYH